jgi:valyl-tRNA synthetase
MASPGTDIAFNIARTEGYRAFANKIWNAARFIFMNVDRAEAVGVHIARSWLTTPPQLTNESRLEELWIISRLNRTAHDVNSALERYRFDDAANFIYQFFWGDFCDWYLEIAKLRLTFAESADNSTAISSLETILYIFQTSLRLLSPFMPFLSEEIWHALYEGKPSRKSIALTSYPRSDQIDWLSEVTSASAETSMDHLKLAITSIRARRKDLGIDDKLLVKAKVASSKSGVLKKNKDVLLKLARLEDAEIILFSDRDGDPKYASLPWQAYGHVDLYIEYEKKIDIAAERGKLMKEIAKQEKIMANGERQLNNPGFTDKAPAHIVEGLNKQLDEARKLLDKLRRDLDGLSG